MSNKIKYSKKFEGLWIFLILISGILASCNQKKFVQVDTPEVSSVIRIPAVSGPLTIDGKLEDGAWQSVLPLSLTNKENNMSGKGGDSKIAVCSGNLCLSARIPESGRLTVHSTGINPAWWCEDMIIWMFRYRSPSTGRNMVVYFAINPFGAFSLGSARDIYNINKNEIPASPPLEWYKDIIAAAEIGKDEWSVEAALPLKYIDTIGFLSVERVRVPRINTPELRWYWPALNEQSSYKITKSTTEQSPLLQTPSVPDNKIIKSTVISFNEPAAEVASLPKQAWSPEEQKSSGICNMLESSIRDRMAVFAEEEKLAWQDVRTVDDWEKFRDKRLTSLLNTIGPLPEHTPLKAKVTRRINYGERFVIENIVFESRPNLLVTANLYLPEKPSGKIPAIIVVHSHHAPKTQSELQDMGMTWARSGTAVLVMDQLCAGERIQTQPWSRESYFGRYILGNQLYLAGESLIKWMAWDIIRGIDLLTERNYIDAKRIVLLGAVAGGGEPAALAANLDPRIAAVIPFNFGEAGPEEHYTEGPRWYDFETAYPGWAFWETTRNLPNSVANQFFPWFICAAVAPRKFIYSFEIGWPKTVEEEPAWARYRKVFELYNASDHLASVDGFGPFPGPGECTNVGTFLRKRIYPVLNRWLDIPVPGSEYHKVIPESELMCLTPASVAERTLKPASVISLELVKQRLNASVTKRAELSANDRSNSLRADLRQKLGDIEPVNIPKVSNLWSRKCSNFVMEAFSVETEAGITIPVFLLTPGNSPVHRPAVIALAEGGKEGFLSERSDEIASLLSKGITVCLPDLRGDGELACSASRGPGAMGLAANELMLGRTMIGSRLKDARTVIRWLEKRPDIDPKNITLWGDSFSEPNAPDFRFDQSPGQQSGPVKQLQAEPLGPFLAILTALYEESVKAVACRGGLISFSSALEENFCHLPQDVIVPGLLEVTDIKDIIGSIAPRPVLLAELVNGLNKEVPLSMMEKEYGSQVSNLTLTEEAQNRLLSEWLAGRCMKND
jgi:dienelactone hydrolase